MEIQFLPTPPPLSFTDTIGFSRMEIQFLPTLPPLSFTDTIGFSRMQIQFLPTPPPLSFTDTIGFSRMQIQFLPRLNRDSTRLKSVVSPRSIFVWSRSKLTLHAAEADGVLQQCGAGSLLTCKRPSHKTPAAISS